jgi:signal transduction histidine kinase
VLGQVLSLTTQSVGAAVGSIFLLDSHGQVVRSILARRNMPPEVRTPTLETVMSKGFGGWVYQQRRADLIRDTRSDPRWYVFPDDPIAVRSALAAPLIRGQQVIGVVTMTHPEPGRFDQEQLELLEAIATQAASAVEKAALHTSVSNDRAMLRAVIGGVQDGILVIDPQDRLLLANPAAQAVLGINDNAYGTPVAAALQEPALAALIVGRPDDGSVEREVTLADGRVYDCNLVWLPQIGWILTMHDVTAFKQLDQLKNELVSQVAHDLKAPLGIVYGYISLLTRLPNISPEDDATYLKPIAQAISRMRALIDNILDIGRIEMGIDAEFEMADMVSIVANAVTNLRAKSAAKGIALEMELGEAPPILGALMRLEQAVTNLIDNALKFTPAGGSVVVRLQQEGEELAVTVTDTGPGVPPEAQGRLFQRFARSGHVETIGQEGHGLGLAIVKSIIEAHRGRVWLQSELGQGSTFAFSLPISHRA